jgi:hypothetical protein
MNIYVAEQTGINSLDLSKFIHERIKALTYKNNMKQYKKNVKYSVQWNVNIVYKLPL